MTRTKYYAECIEETLLSLGVSLTDEQINATAAAVVCSVENESALFGHPSSAPRVDPQEFQRLEAQNQKLEARCAIYRDHIAGLRGIPGEYAVDIRHGQVETRRIG